MVVSQEFWRGKRVFVTGHTGFKGSWLCLWLQSLGAQVEGYSLDPPSRPSLYEVARVGEGMQDVRGDIRDLGTLQTAVAQQQPEIVFHLAAQSLVRYSYLHPIETLATNVMGTAHVLEAVRRTPSVRVAVIVTSDKCYENREWVWGYRENEPMGGHDPYSSSKGCAELVTNAYRCSYFNVSEYTNHKLAVATVRAGNVIGGGDWADDRLIPDFMRAILAGRPLIIRNPDAIRPWQHVLDPLSGYMLLAERLWAAGPEFAEAWNFGPHEENAKSVEWIVERLMQLWGGSASWQLDGREHPHEAHYLKLDSSKARMKLGWQPRWDIETALKSVIEWYRAYFAKVDMRETMLKQIASYQETFTGERV